MTRREAIQRAGGRAWVEPRFKLQYSDDQHTDIKFVFGATVGYVDVSVVHPTAATYVGNAQRGPLRAAQTIGRSKDRQYLARATSEHASFYPFVLETYWGFGRRARELIRVICQHADSLSDVWSSAEIRASLLRDVTAALHVRYLHIMVRQLNLS